MGLKEATATRLVGGSDTDEGWVVFFAFPSSSLYLRVCESAWKGQGRQSNR